MNGNNIRIVLILIFCFSYGLLGERLKFHNISIEDGLSQSTVNCIMQDSKGFIWFGTHDGLNRFDGYQFSVYRNDPDDSGSISHDYITCMMEDRNGNFWVGTEEGLNLYDRDSGSFIQFIHSEEDPGSLINNSVTSLYGDKTGRLWIGTSRGLDCYRTENGTFIHFPHVPGDPRKPFSQAIYSICEDKSGSLWMACYGAGFVCFNPSTGDHRQIKIPNSIPGNDYIFETVFVDSSGMIWIGTTNSGLIVFDPLKNDFIFYRNKPDCSGCISDNFIHVIFEDSQGNLWVGTEHGGLNRFDRESKKFKNFLSYTRILSIYEDIHGSLWFGTWSEGVFRYDLVGKPFVHFKQDRRSMLGLSANGIYALLEDHEGHLWIGTKNGGLNMYDRIKDSVSIYRHDPSNPHSISNDNVWSISEDKLGNLWIGTSDGLNCFNAGRKRFTCFKNSPEFPGSLADNIVYAVKADRRGRIWLGTHMTGLDCLHPDTGIFTHYQRDIGNDCAIRGVTVWCFLEDHNGTIWAGTNGGLTRLDPRQDCHTTFYHDKNNPASLSDDRVFCVFEDSERNLWVGTMGGLNLFDKKSELFTHFGVKDGFKNNVIYGILEDNHGNLWLSTNLGITQFNRDSGLVQNYGVDDGLQSNEFNLAHCRSRSGELFFGGINGFNSFYPDQIKKNPFPPAIVITDFYILNRRVRTGEEYNGRVVLDRSIMDLPDITLTHRDHEFSFEFVGLNYISPHSNEYAYKLEGFDRDWKYIGNRRFLSYTNLSGGHYLLRIKGSNNDGVWNEVGVTLSIFIKPPFWKTWWFYTLCCILALVLLLVLHAVRVQQIIRRERKRYARSSLPCDKVEEYKSILQNLFENEKIYLESDLSLQNLSDRSSIQLVHLSQLFTSHLNTRFHDYVNRYRVEEAKRRLTDPSHREKKLLQIALEVGFNAIQTFNRVFKKFTGVPPSQFRERAESNNTESKVI